ncbi:hypothetical protein KAW96_10485 [candidate division WOR-3 bacterium]|nr:hypothetical protein [candidate division WOR-3 bacterium]
MKKKLLYEIRNKRHLSKLLISLLLIFSGCIEIDDQTGGDVGKIEMHVEYDYQNDFWLENYDVFRNGEDRLKTSYSNANTQAFVHPDETSLTPEALTYVGIILELIDHYYENNWTNAGNGPHHTICLFGMLDQTPRIPGVTHWSFTIHDEGSAWGEPFCSSVIFTGFLADTLSKAPFYWYDYMINDAIDLIVIHELGHSRGGFPTHCPWGGIIPCVMADGLHVDEDYQLLYWHDFCDDCSAVIEAVEWEPNW